MFDAYPTYSRYRSLALLNPMQRGEDVYALQTALNACGFTCGAEDGILGKNTAQAIKNAQVSLGIFMDGLAGGRTQEGLAMRIARFKAEKLQIPLSGIRGQLEHESGFRLGNYSPLRADTTYDAGVSQRNTKYTKPEEAFDVPLSIQVLVENAHTYFELFAGVAGARRWGLAMGAWNAPAFACYIAREEGAWRVNESQILRPGSGARVVFEQYVREVSLYLTV